MSDKSARSLRSIQEIPSQVQASLSAKIIDVHELWASAEEIPDSLTPPANHVNFRNDG